MTLGPIMADVAGLELQDVERERLMHPLIGAVILFARNYESPQQVAALTQSIHSLREPRLLVCVDHEGGRVQRFRKGFTELPPMHHFGDLYEDNPKRARRLAEQCGWLLAAELRAVDIDFSFTPVLDMDRGISQVIGDRAFHSSPDIITNLAHELMHGLKRAGRVAIGKHFPGHGGVEADSHVDMPVDERSYDDIAMEDLVPFSRMIEYGLAGIMPAHVVYKNVDPMPAGFSHFWLQQVLRQRLGFEGVIFSDDLSMAGAHVVGDMVQRARAALQAGCDMALVCNDPDSVDTVLDGLEWSQNPASAMRISRLHGKNAMAWAELQKSREYLQTRDVVSDLLAL